MKRRQLLGSTVTPLLGCATTLSFAGCLSTTDDAGASVLGAVLIVNRHEHDHIVDFRVQWNGDAVHESTHEMEGWSDEGPESTAVPAKTWPDEAGQFTVAARIQGTDWHTVNPANRGYPECYAVHVDITGEGRLRMLTSTNEYECTEEALQHNRNATSSPPTSS